jgi:hypothetical protein
MAATVVVGVVLLAAGGAVIVKRRCPTGARGVSKASNKLESTQPGRQGSRRGEFRSVSAICHHCLEVHPVRGYDVLRVRIHSMPDGEFQVGVL